MILRACGARGAAVTSPMQSGRKELRQLAHLSAPIVATQVGMMLLGVVDTMMIGQVGTNPLAAAALATQFASVSLMFAMGVIMGIDPLISQAYGAGRNADVGRALQQGLALVLILSVLLAMLWTGLHDVLLWWGTHPELALMAQGYLSVQIPGIPFFLGTIALRAFLQNRNITRPALLGVALTNVINVGLNAILIFGWGPVPALGLIGAGWATTLSRIAMGLLLWSYIVVARLHAGYWVAWERSVLAWSRLRRVLALGVPVGLSTLVEVTAFSGSTYIAARLGERAIAAHTIVLNVASLLFMVPLGLAIGASARMGQHIGRGDLEATRTTRSVALLCATAVMTSAALLLLLFRHHITTLYTTDAAVMALAISIFPIVAAFQVLDGTQVVAAGLLRGLGRTRFTFLTNVGGYYVLALPLGTWLALTTKLGVAGLWWGLFAGLAVVAVALITWLFTRGQLPPSR